VAAAFFGVMRNVSVPRGIGTPNQPNIPSTIRRTIADRKNRIYIFKNTTGPSIVRVLLDRIDFSPDSGVRKLTFHGQLQKDRGANFLAPP